ncbi:hypothetical protein L1987_86064 [Smallanthus sonchifolius]|uniref:Uncharacterized protein n=1 Tax=Smallanthus sonchifolius TaxID=185202 RepID=A0ACB8XY91_9ASTR|nr:hypothetical protein L1987_86064 [Smallanthus sonchifolius]
MYSLTELHTGIIPFSKTNRQLLPLAKRFTSMAVSSPPLLLRTFTATKPYSTITIPLQINPVKSKRRRIYLCLEPPKETGKRIVEQLLAKGFAVKAREARGGKWERRQVVAEGEGDEGSGVKV